ncbi:MAG TPA: CerR family C-terminal domain-containing protein [Tepidisphaeraceae bacterium]|nr:CerR family C-terminal domain-containing protein [Tepidisphaeraceae bacterium]
MPNVKNNAAAQETCRKLIEAAGEVFAERGLHAATIKEITDRAGVNTAAINYHFSDKFELYAAVIRDALSRTPIAPSAEKLAGSPEDRLRAFITDVIDDLYDPSRPAWQATLLAHEFAQPTAALDAVVEELIRPRADYLNNIIRDILGPHASEEQIVTAGLSVSSPCFLYLYHREVIRRLHPHLLRDDNRDELATHITDFALAALHALRKQLKPCRQPR